MLKQFANDYLPESAAILAFCRLQGKTFFSDTYCSTLEEPEQVSRVSKAFFRVVESLDCPVRESFTCELEFVTRAIPNREKSSRGVKRFAQETLKILQYFKSMIRANERQQKRELVHFVIYGLYLGIRRG